MLIQSGGAAMFFAFAAVPSPPVNLFVGCVAAAGS
jgi:hypothetical protein